MALSIITQRPALNVQASQVLILRTMTDVWHGPAGDPGAAKITDLLMSPPSPAEIIAETERLEFSD